MKITSPFAIAFALALIANGSHAQAADKPKLDVLNGPLTAKLGTVSRIEVPEGYVFLDGDGTRALLTASGERTSGNELGFLRPTNAAWSVFFEFDDIGYVKDAEKEKLDADAILDSIKKGTAQQNKHREAAGHPPLIVVG